MPLQVVGQRAEEHVTSDSIIGLVVDGPYFELHGLEIAEGLLDQAQLFIGGDYFARSHLLFGHLTTDDVTAVKEFFGHDLVLVKAPGEPSRSQILESSCPQNEKYVSFICALRLGSFDYLAANPFMQLGEADLQLGHGTQVGVKASR